MGRSLRRNGLLLQSFWSQSCWHHQCCPRLLLMFITGKLCLHYSLMSWIVCLGQTWILDLSRIFIHILLPHSKKQSAAPVNKMPLSRSCQRSQVSFYSFSLSLSLSPLSLSLSLPLSLSLSLSPSLPLPPSLSLGRWCGGWALHLGRSLRRNGLLLQSFWSQS